MKYNSLTALARAGFSDDDASALRRVSMTLQRWHELECGDSNNYASWAVERDGNEPDSKPYLVTHPHNGSKSYRRAIPDRETGARKRLAKIMTNYPEWIAHIQGDPRGCALYVIKRADIPTGADVDAYYNRGVAICR